MSRWRYPEQLDEFIRGHCKEHTAKEIAKLANKEPWGTEITPERVHAYMSSRGIRVGIKGRHHDKPWIFSEEIRDYIDKNHKGCGPASMAAAINERFGTQYTRQQLKSYYANHGINSGTRGHFEKGHVPYTKGKTWDEYMSAESQANSRRTTFKRGHTPENELPIGTVSKTTDGYLIRKIATTPGPMWNRWEFLHRAVWEENFGPIPEDKVVSFKDGDQENCSPDNLMLISNNENLELNRSGLRFDRAEATESGLLVAKVRIAARNKKRRNKKQ